MLAGVGQIQGAGVASLDGDCCQNTQNGHLERTRGAESDSKDSKEGAVGRER